MKKITYWLCVALLAGVFLLSGGLLLKDQWGKYQEGKAFQAMRDQFPDSDPEIVLKKSSGEILFEIDPTRPIRDQVSPQQWKEWWSEKAEGRFAVYQSMAAENSDMIGWVKIEGMIIDYPVCFTPNDPEFYLHRDFKKRNSAYGTPFLDGICRPDRNHGNLLLYGHHMRNGQMFASLQDYVSEEHYKLHPFIQYDTLHEAGSYEIVAVIRLDAEGTQVSWQKLLFPQSKKEFEQARAEVERRQFYDTGLRLDYMDRLLALVTCEYTQKNGRLMVIARKIK